MGRSILAIVVGYLVFFCVEFLVFSAAYVALGANGAFRPGSYEVSAVWTALGLAICFVAALLGGLVAAVIGRNALAPRILAVIVLVLGLVFALPTLTGARPADHEPRGTSVGLLEAMQKAQTPPAEALAAPLIGLVGVLVGASLRRRRAQ